MKRTHGRRAALVTAFIVCLAAGQAAHAINFNVNQNGNCEAGGVHVTGEITASFDLASCTADLGGSVCAEKDGDPAGCCAAGTCSPEIDRITLFTQSPTIGSPCTTNGLALVLCDGASCTNPETIGALLGPTLWPSLYANGSIMVEWSGAGSGVSWGSVQAVDDKEPPTCNPIGAPTLSEWSMILMTGLLALGGIRVLRRRMLRSE